MPYHRRPACQVPPTLEGKNTCPRCGKGLNIKKVKGMGKRNPVGTPYLVCFCLHSNPWWYFFREASNQDNNSLPERKIHRVRTTPTRNRSGSKCESPNGSSCTILVDARNSSFSSVGGDQHYNPNVATTANGPETPTFSLVLDELIERLYKMKLEQK